MIRKLYPYIIAFYAFLYRPKRKDYFNELAEILSERSDRMAYKKFLEEKLDEAYEKGLEEIRKSIDREIWDKKIK